MHIWQIKFIYIHVSALVHHLYTSTLIKEEQLHCSLNKNLKADTVNLQTE